MYISCICCIRTYMFSGSTLQDCFLASRNFYDKSREVYTQLKHVAHACTNFQALRFEIAFWSHNFFFLCEIMYLRIRKYISHIECMLMYIFSGAAHEIAFWCHEFLVQNHVSVHTHLYLLAYVACSCIFVDRSNYRSLLQKSPIKETVFCKRDL